MKQQDRGKVITEAREICARSGARLTEKRTRILELLLLANKPLSAYEIKHAYDSRFAESVPVMSVYRILEFFESRNLAHKLSSTKQYLLCSHITSSQTHDIPQFLICGECQSAKEILISNEIIGELTRVAQKAGFTLTDSQLELQCLCRRCLTNKVELH